MLYRDMLRNGIQKSGLLLREVADKCAESGLIVDIATLSRMRDGKQRPLKDSESNAVLAYVIDVPEHQFVIAAAMEYTPKEVLDVLADGHVSRIADLSAAAREIVSTKAVEFVRSREARS